MMTVLHIFSVEGHKCGFDRICTCMFRPICTQVLYLMDRFNVSDKFYHELSMVQPTIPHRIKRVRSELNQSLKTKMYRVPGPNHGIYCSLTERLSEELEVIVSTAAHDVPNCILYQIQLDPDSSHEVFKINLSGDGAKFSRCSNFFLVSFAILNLEQRLLSPRGNFSYKFCGGCMTLPLNR